jgi:transcription termination factor Rho
MDITAATEAILQRMAETENNQEFLERLTEDQS